MEEGRKLIRRIELDEMVQRWFNCVDKYGMEWYNRHQLSNWITSIKNPKWSDNIIWDEEEGCWLEYEDNFLSQFNMKIYNF